MLNKIMNEWMMVVLGALSILLIACLAVAAVVVVGYLGVFLTESLGRTCGIIFYFILLLGTPFIYHLIKKIREKK